MPICAFVHPCVRSFSFHLHVNIEFNFKKHKCNIIMAATLEQNWKSFIFIWIILAAIFDDKRKWLWNHQCKNNLHFLFIDWHYWMIVWKTEFSMQSQIKVGLIRLNLLHRMYISMCDGNSLSLHAKSHTKLLIGSLAETSKVYV